MNEPAMDKVNLGIIKDLGVKQRVIHSLYTEPKISIGNYYCLIALSEISSNESLGEKISVVDCPFDESKSLLYIASRFKWLYIGNDKENSESMFFIHYDIPLCDLIGWWLNGGTIAH